MKVKEYKEQIKRTLPDLGSQLLNSLHMSTGIVSETHELLVAVSNKDIVNIGEELIDKAWYSFNYAFINNIDLGDFEFPNTQMVVNYPGMDSDYCGEQVIFFEGELLDMDKKWLAYGRERDLERARTMLLGVLGCINNAAVHYKVDLEQAMENNINKLKVRFADKFTTEEANTRDLDAERVELEK